MSNGEGCGWAVVVPPGWDTPVRVIAYEPDLLAMCYREIGCRTVERLGLGTELEVWLDEDGLWARPPEPNARATGLALTHLRRMSQVLVGVAVFTGAADEHGDTQSLTRSAAEDLTSRADTAGRRVERQLARRDPRDPV